MKAKTETKTRKSWMTDTGNALLAAGTLLGAASAAFPLEKYRGWLVFLGIISGGLGQIMANKGIRRRLPMVIAASAGSTTLREPGKPRPPRTSGRRANDGL